LIENYQKQIKLLEEAAQRLYKEWFIDLHFPGHENTKIVDGVPEGWEKKRLADVAELKAGGDKPDIVSDVRTEDCAIPIFSNGTTNEGLYGFTNF
jgi:type I restriction enzyme S subunit